MLAREGAQELEPVLDGREPLGIAAHRLGVPPELAARLLELDRRGAEQAERRLEPAVEQGGLAERARGLPDALRAAPLLPVGERLCRARRLAELLRGGEDAPLVLERLELARARIGVVELGELEGEVVGATRPLALVRGERLPLADERRERRVGGAVPLEEARRVVEPRERVEEVEVRSGIEERDVLVLAGDVDDPPQRLLEHRDGAERPVHEGPSPAAARCDPPHEQLAGVRRQLAGPSVARRSKAGRLEAREHPVRRGQLEERLHHRLVRAVAEHLPAHPSAEDEVERVHEDGLAGAGLAREDVQPRTEPDLDRVDDREARDAQRREHGDMIHAALTLRKYSVVHPFPAPL